MSAWTARIGRWIGPATAGLVLLGVASTLQSRQTPSAVAEYHRQVRLLGASVPVLIGNWIGKDTPIAIPAIKILQPNVMFNRRYSQPGEPDYKDVTLMLVQTSDAWNMNYHWPPHCYKHSGYTKASETPHAWEVGGETIPLKEYVFEKVRSSGVERLHVLNFMFLKGGLADDNTAIDRMARDPLNRFYGAGQIQVVFTSAYDEKERRRIFSTLVEACMPVIRQVTKGVEP
jgi:hypothetical protein